MPKDASNAPILVLAGIVILALQVRIVQRGTFSAGWFSGVTRENDPLGFWFIVGVNLLLGLSALLLGALGIGKLIGGR